MAGVKQRTRGTIEKAEPARERQGEPLVRARARRRGAGWLRAVIALRQRNFRLYWGGQLISVMGIWMQLIGQAWLVLELTHSAWQLGLVGALQALPILFLSIFAGVLADRWPKRPLLLVMQTAAMLQAAALWSLVATGAIQVWEIYVLAVLLGLTNSLSRPVSRAYLVELVGRENLPNASALDSAVSSLARIVGPGLGGVIIAASGVSALFLLNALSFLPLLAAIALIDSRELHVQPAPVGRNANGRRDVTTWQSLREGLAYVWRSPAVLMLLLVAGLVLLFGSNFNVVLPLFATSVLHVGATGFGLLSAATGVGALLAAFWLAWGNRQPTIRGVLGIMLAFGVLEAAFAVSRLYALSLALITAVGFTEEAFAVQAMTALQIIAPDGLRGRVMSVQTLFFDGSLPLGYVLMGLLAGLYGAPAAVLIGALLSLLTVGAGWLWRRPAEKDMAAPAG